MNSTSKTINKRLVRSIDHYQRKLETFAIVKDLANGCQKKY